MDGTRSASGTPDGAQGDGIASTLSNRDLAAQIAALSGHLNASNHRLLVLIAEFDRRLVEAIEWVASQRQPAGMAHP